MPHPRDINPWDSGEINMLEVMQRGLDLSRSPGSRFKREAPTGRQVLRFVRKAGPRLTPWQREMLLQFYPVRTGGRLRMLWAWLRGRCPQCRYRSGHRLDCGRRWSK